MRYFLWAVPFLLLAVYSLTLMEETLPQPAVITPYAQSATIKEETTFVANLPDYGSAPEFHEGAWLNTDQALRLADLRGKVVLLEMWTFDCINCIRTIPYLRQWHETYSDQGLVIIGNHYPEFNYEYDISNLKDALTRLEIAYPVLQDNDRETWNAYNNRYWPTIYLIDKQGHIRYHHIGEGAYETTEQAIQDLLRETYIPPAISTSVDTWGSLTPHVVLNVRTGPSIDSESIGSISLGEVYAVRGEEEGWYKIRFKGQEAYVSGEYVTINN